MITPVSLGTWPTPLEAAPRLAARLGLAEFWFKRDDLNGLGGGGNKIRKLQYTCAEAIAVGATTVITSGAPQSNHARLTAAAAARLGLSCVLVLAGPPPEIRRGNLLLDGLAGAEIVWGGDSPLAEVVAVEAQRRAAYVIPFGGTSPASTQGYVDCGRELRAQVPDIDGTDVVVALGSGGTMAGLVRELGAGRVIGVDVGALPDPRATVAGLLVGEVEPGALRIDGSQVGAGYRTLTDGARAALETTARDEGIFLDPTYTGRAMAALLAGSFPHGDKVVFLHSGGLPGLFGHPEL
ncbi:pyridoxal-phosphate dependent enzyme [Micromonospora parathelypteridis]|uniref:D-cysteine desulfhydrase n=1 Tax=Micromonospora parathelypteridis TaxID=1839617 RepID=A0A840VTX1_9ACTN|nr:pyridoxal-phosphate dependent enzyme [Micromonospora parathelypteridis]MBB5476020.1 D-cysteine desulfhydrase [Micromonospora parathelypteridis]GGO32452.1 1-aminocyclopropane-1-carboxylate deaminase [Micromonospora parathelypteridis]